jgi:hypothetical protein
MTNLANELANRPALSFGGAFFTVAVKEGSSELLLLDFNDDPNGISWIVPLGDWEGGQFCVPQLGMKNSNSVWPSTWCHDQDFGTLQCTSQRSPNHFDFIC